MEFNQAMRVIKRICELLDGCEKCELKLNCPFLTIPSELDYDKAETILAKWAEEHPEKTIADDFYDKHPKAKRRDDGTPIPCVSDCGYIDRCRPGEKSCAECWRRPLEEVEG